MRFVVALGMAALCGSLAVALHYQNAAIAAQPSDGFMIEAPPPPSPYFPEAFLVIPGALAGSPLALAGAIMEREWLTQVGLVLGAAVFWYCVGWQIDSARGVLKSERAPVMVRWYLSAMIVLSVILLPFGVLAGFSLGVHVCANEVFYPYWADVVGYGILMFWITVGCYFGWQRFRAGRKHKDSLVSLRKGLSPSK